MLFINKNKNAKDTYEKALEYLKESKSYLVEINPNISLSRNQLFSKHKMLIKANEVPLVLGIINVYYERVNI